MLAYLRCLGMLCSVVNFVCWSGQSMLSLFQVTQWWCGCQVCLKGLSNLSEVSNGCKVCLETAINTGATNWSVRAKSICGGGVTWCESSTGPVQKDSLCHSAGEGHLSWTCCCSTIVLHTIPVYRPKHTFELKNSHFACAGFQEKFDTPPLKPTKTEPSFRKLNSPPTKLHYAFSRLPPGQGVMPTNLLPVIAPRMEPSYTHMHPLA